MTGLCELVGIFLSHQKGLGSNKLEHKHAERWADAVILLGLLFCAHWKIAFLGFTKILVKWFRKGLA